MCLTTVSSIRYMTYKLYDQRQMLMVELRLNMIIEGNPYLINALDRSANHHLIRGYSYMINLKPFFLLFLKLKPRLSFITNAHFVFVFVFF